jgi:ABC-type protease/lipase transport system fused ATPase/permease subunit
VLLLDEPAANLDEPGREILQRVLDAQRHAASLWWRPTMRAKPPLTTSESLL